MMSVIVAGLPPSSLVELYVLTRDWSLALSLAILFLSWERCFEEAIEINKKGKKEEEEEQQQQQHNKNNNETEASI